MANKQYAIFKKKGFLGRHLCPEVLSCFDFKDDEDYRPYPYGSQFSKFIIGKTKSSLEELAKKYDGIIRSI